MSFLKNFRQNSVLSKLYLFIFLVSSLLKFVFCRTQLVGGILYIKCKV